MRIALAVVFLALSAAVPLEAQEDRAGYDDEAAYPEREPTPGTPTLEDPGQEAAPSALAADWSELQTHWGMVQAAAPGEKERHLEMHRSMVDAFMGELEAHIGAPTEGAVAREGRPPAVGERMAGADRAPVEADRGAEAAAAEEADRPPGEPEKPGERIEDERADEAELRGHEQTAAAELERVQAHWKMVQGIRDPAQLEEHLAMHMQMLDEVLAPAVEGKPGRGVEGLEETPEHEMPEHEIEHEMMDHGDMEHGQDEPEDEETEDPQGGES